MGGTATLRQVDGTDKAAVLHAVTSLAPTTATVNYVYVTGTQATIVKYDP